MQPKTLVRLLALLALVLVFNAQLRAAPYDIGTAFTYQGRLTDSGSAANGSYDLKFTLYDNPTSGTGVVGGPLTNSAVAVSNGLFTVTLTDLTAPSAKQRFYRAVTP